MAAPNVQFATTNDGVRIAYADSGGEKPALLWTPGWISHVEMDWRHPRVSQFYRRFAENHRLIQFDGRGTGLSDRDVEGFSAEARARDILAVVDALALEQTDLLAWSQWSPPAVVFAAEHPERVSRLVLYAGFAHWRSGDPKLGEALVAIIRAEQRVGARAVDQFIYPDVSPDEENNFIEYYQASASAEVAATILEEGFFRVDVTEQARKISVPTLVLHRQGDTAVEFGSGREIASLIPGARLVPLEGNIHVPWHGDDDAFFEAVESFLGVATAPRAPKRTSAPVVAASPVALLFTDIEGSTTLTEHVGDAAAQEIVGLHDRIVRTALRDHGGSEVKHTGDGIMASFPAATAALEASVEIQQAIAALTRDGEQAKLRVRIGVNAGEPIRQDGDLFGTAVQVARRICDLAAPGEILVSNVVRELAAGKGFLFSDRGEVPLRGIEEPLRLFDVNWSDGTP